MFDDRDDVLDSDSDLGSTVLSDTDLLGSPDEDLAVTAVLAAAAAAATAALDGAAAANDDTPDPVGMFRRWLDEYDGGSGLMKNAMHLSTVRADGQPRSRMVLLKGVDADGRFLFGTDGGSDKGREIAANPKVALLFYWGSRQVRVEGVAEPAPGPVSDAVFAERPRDHQISAWASRQSAPVVRRDDLAERRRAFDRRFDVGPVPRPPNWGAFAVRPHRFEFWQLGAARLHDRVVHERSSSSLSGTWTTIRLQP
ncbi:pyridoxal 5'-phosphate synthase [Plasmodiophora brassicae]